MVKQTTLNKEQLMNAAKLQHDAVTCIEEIDEALRRFRAKAKQLNIKSNIRWELLLKKKAS